MIRNSARTRRGLAHMLGIVDELAPVIASRLNRAERADYEYAVNWIRQQAQKREKKERRAPGEGEPDSNLPGHRVRG